MPRQVKNTSFEILVRQIVIYRVKNLNDNIFKFFENKIAYS